MRTYRASLAAAVQAAAAPVVPLHPDEDERGQEYLVGEQAGDSHGLSPSPHGQANIFGEIYLLLTLLADSGLH